MTATSRAIRLRVVRLVGVQAQREREVCYARNPYLSLCFTMGGTGCSTNLVGVQAQREREVALAAQLGRGAHAHAQALVGAARASQHVLHETYA